MRRARYIASLKRLEQARQELGNALERFGDATRDVTAAVEDGAALAASLRDLQWVAIRRSMEEAWGRFQHAGTTLAATRS